MHTPQDNGNAPSTTDHNEADDGVSSCPLCFEPIDFCRGHGDLNAEVPTHRYFVEVLPGDRAQAYVDVLLEDGTIYDTYAVGTPAPRNVVEDFVSSKSALN